MPSAATSSSARLISVHQISWWALNVQLQLCCVSVMPWRKSKAYQITFAWRTQSNITWMKVWYDIPYPDHHEGWQSPGGAGLEVYLGWASLTVCLSSHHQPYMWPPHLLLLFSFFWTPLTSPISHFNMLCKYVINAVMWPTDSFIYRNMLNYQTANLPLQHWPFAKIKWLVTHNSASNSQGTPSYRPSADYEPTEAENEFLQHRFISCMSLKPFLRLFHANNARYVCPEVKSIKPWLNLGCSEWNVSAVLSP